MADKKYIVRAEHTSGSKHEETYRNPDLAKFVYNGLDETNGIYAELDEVDETTGEVTAVAEKGVSPLRGQATAHLTVMTKASS